MKKLLSTLAALALSGALAAAAYLPPLTGPQDPSQLNATINQLQIAIQSGVDGLVASQSSTVASTATTAEQNLASVTIPANVLTQSGQSLSLRCAGLFNGSGHTNTVKLYYGTSSSSTGAVVSTNGSFDLTLLVTYDASATASKYIARATYGSTGVAVVATANTTDNLASTLTAKCTATQGTASAGDVSLMDFLVMQVK